MAGYYDGDGTLAVTFGVFTANLLGKWDDTDAELINHVREFLISEGVNPEKTAMRRGRGRGKDAYFLTVAAGGGLIIVLKRMLPFLDKKKGQVSAAIDYLEDRITCDQLVEALNQSILQKKRRSPTKGDIFPKVNIPYTRTEGQKRAKDVARAARKFPLSVRLRPGETDQILREVKILGLSFKETASLHKISPQSVRRLVRGCR